MTCWSRTVTSLSEIFQYCSSYTHQLIYQTLSKQLPTSFDLQVFLDVFPVDSVHHCFFMSIGHINEAYQFWSIVKRYFVFLTPNTTNLKVLNSCAPTFNIIFILRSHFSEIYHFHRIWNHLLALPEYSPSYQLHHAKETVHCHIHSLFPLDELTHDWLSCTMNKMYYLIHKNIFLASIPVTLGIHQLVI